MATDIEIARQATMKPIGEIATRLGIPDEALEPYGRTKAKIAMDWINTQADKPDGKLILVTAINPTPAGEGKTTTSVGLTDGPPHRQERRVCLRDPPRASFGYGGAPVRWPSWCRWKTSPPYRVSMPHHRPTCQRDIDNHIYGATRKPRPRRSPGGAC